MLLTNESGNAAEEITILIFDVDTARSNESFNTPARKDVICRR